MTRFTEAHVEEAALAWLLELGYDFIHGPDIAPESDTPERMSYGEVILAKRLQTAVAQLNLHIPPEAQAEAIRRVKQAEYPALTEENQRLHKYLVEGVPVEFTGADGAIKGDHVRLVDFSNPAVIPGGVDADRYAHGVGGAAMRKIKELYRRPAE